MASSSSDVEGRIAQFKPIGPIRRVLSVSPSTMCRAISGDTGHSVLEALFELTLAERLFTVRNAIPKGANR
jgi:hypothetical protein